MSHHACKDTSPSPPQICPVAKADPEGRKPENVVWRCIHWSPQVWLYQQQSPLSAKGRVKSFSAAAGLDLVSKRKHLNQGSRLFLSMKCLKGPPFIACRNTTSLVCITKANLEHHLWCSFSDNSRSRMKEWVWYYGSTCSSFRQMTPNLLSRMPFNSTRQIIIQRHPNVHKKRQHVKSHGVSQL